VIGYSQTFFGTAAFGGKYITNTNFKLTSTMTPGGALAVPIGAIARRVLTACANLTDSGSSDVYTTMLGYNWVNVDGGFTVNGVAKGHISAHMKNAKVPDGCWVGMLDSHVEWRNFKQFQSRTSSSPYFYW
jgi:hypothetical protein